MYVYYLYVIKMLKMLQIAIDLLHINYLVNKTVKCSANVNGIFAFIDAVTEQSCRLETIY